MLADGNGMSTHHGYPIFGALLRGGLGRRPGLIPIPLSLLETALRVAGRNEIYHRLAGSLVADPSAISRLGWAPTVTTQEGLAALARG